MFALGWAFAVGTLDAAGAVRRRAVGVSENGAVALRVVAVSQPEVLDSVAIRTGRAGLAVT